MTAEERRERILRGPILRTVLTLAAPNALTVLAQTAVTIADAAYVGRLGTEALAALALVFPTQIEQGRTYLRTVGPVYGLFGLAMALYFASQGTGAMLWPVFANVCRISVAVGGGLFSLSVLGLGARGLYACVALGITVFSAILAYSTTTRAWRPDRA